MRLTGSSGMAMMFGRILLAATISICVTSCVTKSLWNATDPEEYVAIPQTEVSEADLQETGVRYRKDDRLGLYYVEKSSLRRFGDYTIRFFVTPVTVFLDTAPAIVVVVGLVALDSLAVKSGGQTRERASRSDSYPNAAPAQKERAATAVSYSGSVTPTAIGTPR